MMLRDLVDPCPILTIFFKFSNISGSRRGLTLGVMNDEVKLGVNASKDETCTIMCHAISL